MERESKYKYVVMAIEALKPGAGLKIRLKKPWGLAALVYKSFSKEERKNLHLRIDKPGKVVYVWRDPEWTEMDMMEVF